MEIRFLRTAGLV